MSTILNHEIAPDNELPAELDVKGFDWYLSAFARHDCESLFRRAYRLDEGRGRYALEPSLPPVVAEALLKAYSAIETEKWYDYATVALVAYYIWCHRRKTERRGDSDDDRRKAEYLVNHVREINRREHRVIVLQMNDEIEEIIELVNNIFDTAYFRKKARPGLSDEECFYSAEREFLQVENETRTLALRYFEWRVAHGEQGDEKSDWELAKKVQPRWHATRRIATIYWNLASNKRQPQEYYWYRACEIVNRLEAGDVPYIGVDPFDKTIYDAIKADLAANS